VIGQVMPPNPAQISLKRPGEGALDETYGKIRELYTRAYDWQPPAPSDDDLLAIRREQSTPLRAYIRRWITEWDSQAIQISSLKDADPARYSSGLLLPGPPSVPCQL
jgi:hypothetical protein